MSKDEISVLVLDDEPIVTKRLKPSLEKAGYKVETFTRSIDALERFRKHPFDIVVTDLKMEGIDGIEFLTEVKELNPKTEVIVITGFATMDTAKESFKRGVFDFLAKPFRLSELKEVLNKAAEKIKTQN
ncbi:Response regulator receiver domain-containing protein [Desulfonauticus submarinus]|uniref:Response regulator receiver domain-containing protein n=1 Tax=Desulfonauticus submarinus TaxID=206665 RepID=A0A1H0CG63_9BACT|nr:response regulator [Desulfonauticus submarinus]SDN56898.1 Response regulator receiver domain-containing protein [Desulfonauticus submarinus]